MNKIRKESICLIGLALKKKTFNANGQSSIDCGALWQEFEKRNIASQISNTLDGDVLAVYYDYEGDYTKPYSYFIGCRVSPGTQIPEGLDMLTIPRSVYHVVTAKGKMPDCVVLAWQQIWDSDFSRAYQFDFELYDKRFLDWQNVEVDIYLSVIP